SRISKLLTPLSVAMAPDTMSTIITLFRPDMQRNAGRALDQLVPLADGLPLNFLGVDLTKAPDSCGDFLNLCEKIFSWEFCKAIESRIRDFDAMIEAGSSSNPWSSHVSLSDPFIRDRSRAVWLESILNSIDMLSINLREQHL